MENQEQMQIAAHTHSVSKHAAVVATRDQVCADLAGESVILHLQSGTYYGLDAVGTWIWEHIQQPRTVGEIRDAMLEEYEVEPGRCEQDLLALLQQLADAGLIEVKDAATA